MGFGTNKKISATYNMSGQEFGGGRFWTTGLIISMPKQELGKRSKNNGQQQKIWIDLHMINCRARWEAIVEIE